jgi:hypothetical protein
MDYNYVFFEIMKINNENIIAKINFKSIDEEIEEVEDDIYTLYGKKKNQNFLIFYEKEYNIDPNIDSKYDCRVKGDTMTLIYKFYDIDNEEFSYSSIFLKLV